MKEPTSYQIEYLKSALSVNTSVGCPMGCEYCSVGQFAQPIVQKLSEPEELVANLLKHRFFVADSTAIAINKDTLEVLRSFSSRSLKNPVVLITKLEVTREDASFLETYAGDVYVFVSYSGLPEWIERAPHKPQMRTIENLQARSKVKLIHYWRPIIEGINDTETSIENMLRDVVGRTDGSVLSGLRLNPTIKDHLSSLGISLDSWNGDTKHKHMPLDSRGRVFSVRDRAAPQHPIWLHTSCAISSFTGKMDYNFHFLKKNACPSSCYNKGMCKLRPAPQREEVESLLNKASIGFSWRLDENALFLQGDLSEEERTFLAYSLCYPVQCSGLLKCPSEEILNTRETVPL